MDWSRPIRRYAPGMTDLRPKGRAAVDTFADLADTLVHDFHIGEFLHLLVERCTTVLDADVAGVLLETAGGELKVSAVTSAVMVDIEKIEMWAGRGPCMDAYRDGEPVIAENLADFEDRWPDVIPELLEMGMHAGYGFPLRLRGDRIGGLSLYQRQARPLREDDIRIAQAFADVATIGILQEREITAAKLRGEHLQLALSSRVDIEQAKGMVAKEHGLTPSEAFEHLREYARRNRQRLHDVCQQVVDGTLDIPCH